MTHLFTVRVWDNFHYMDEDEAYNEGSYETYEQALAVARKIVEESVAHHGYDYAQYAMFGEDPGILCPPGTHFPLFSARDYASDLCSAHHREDRSN